MNSDFSLRAHAALILLRKRDFMRRKAEGKPAIQAVCSDFEIANSHSAGQSGHAETARPSDLIDARQGIGCTEVQINVYTSQA